MGSFAIQLSNGKYMWARLDRKNDCFELLVGNTDTNIWGNASNCSQEIEGYWSVQSCSGRDSLYSVGPSEVINKIVSM